MTIAEIISSVRLCIDEEKRNDADFISASAGDVPSMDNIIRAKIGDALRWICLYGNTELMSGKDEQVTTGFLKDVSGTFSSTSPQAGFVLKSGYGLVTLPEDFVRLSRVRVNGWHRSVRVPFREESDEYLALWDSHGATATTDRPQAAVIDKSVKELELWPVSDGDEVEYSYVADVSDVQDYTDPTVTSVSLPPKMKTAFIYYIAFLLLSAYGDARSIRMLEIAKMNVGREG